MDFLKNTKNGRVLPFSPVLDTLPHMKPWGSPDPDYETMEEYEAAMALESPADPVTDEDKATLPDFEALTRLELIAVARNWGLPVTARMSRADVVALFPQPAAPEPAPVVEPVKE